MRNLWRALALAWLGGVASPGLADDTLLPDTMPSTLIVDDAPDDEQDEGQEEEGTNPGDAG